MNNNTSTSERPDISKRQIAKAIKLIGKIDSGELHVGNSVIKDKIIQTFQPFVRYAQLANDNGKD